MKMSKRHTQEFFNVLDADKSGGLTINEFKEFLFREESRDGFRHLMRRVRVE
jgi:Ca2+-binding EF-hand superfamily protein